MSEDACRLNARQRAAVERQIGETCRQRGWSLHAVNCRSNHVHVVVSAGETRPKKICSDLKAWATRCLKQHACSLADVSCSLADASGYDAERENWWAERGSIRHLYDETSVEAAVQYVTEAQDLPR